MSSLFRNHFANKRENAVKEALISTLQENLRELQYEVQQSGRDYLELCESTNSLCTTLEAIFLHGLKDSFLWQTINVIAGDVDRRPEPSFWSPLMVFLHKQVIEQIQSLSQITSEIGQCRAWIRLSVNESIVSSYLNNIRKDNSALRPYYKNYALLKDADGLEIAAKILEGIESQIEINLPVNSSLLNQWPNYALQLSGIWTPALKSCPISSGVDVVSSIPADTIAIPTPQPLRTNELFSESISNSPFTQTCNFTTTDDLTQNEKLDIFLQKVDEMDIIAEEDNVKAKEQLNENIETTKKNETKFKKNKKKRKHSLQNNLEEKLVENEDRNENAQSIHGNSLTNLMQNSWSSDVDSKIDLHRQHSNQPMDENGSFRYVQRSVSMTSSVSSLRSPLDDRCSYNTLLRKHERNSQVDWTEVWEKFLLQNATGTQGQTAEEQDKPETIDRGSNASEFELLSYTVLDKFDIIELQEMVEQLCKLAHEPGLDAQSFLCRSCQHPLGIGYSNFQVCAISGYYFCDKCMAVEQVLVPARIIFNWDFRKYSISKRAAEFLEEFKNQPFIDLKLLNPEIYNVSEAMAELQSLRIRLNFIRAYLYTCSPSSIEELRRHLFGHEYLYEHIHQYSIADLAMIQRGTLAQQLQKAYKLGEAHILKCGLCSLKGFICEICKSSRVLYPFHIDSTYRCEACGAVFHAQCLNKQQPCPKCERKKRREDLPLQEAMQI